MPPTSFECATRRRELRGAIMAGIEAWRWKPTSPFGSNRAELAQHSARTNEALNQPIIDGTSLPAV